MGRDGRLVFLDICWRGRDSKVAGNRRALTSLQGMARSRIEPLIEKIGSRTIGSKRSSAGLRARLATLAVGMSR